MDKPRIIGTSVYRAGWWLVTWRGHQPDTAFPTRLQALEHALWCVANKDA